MCFTLDVTRGRRGEGKGVGRIEGEERSVEL